MVPVNLNLIKLKSNPSTKLFRSANLMMAKEKRYAVILSLKKIPGLKRRIIDKSSKTYIGTKPTITLLVIIS
jgi:hypothetical protein